MILNFLLFVERFLFIQRKLYSLFGCPKGAVFCPTAVGTRGKGGIPFPKRIPPLEPPEKGEGCSPRPPTLPDWSSKSCTRCALHSRWQLCCLTDVAYPLRVIGCGVHGFAMNPCNSRPLSTAPYYREARVTSERRQTACRMRHCWRSPHCGVLR